MKLSAESLMDLIDSLRSSPRDNEKRKAPRVGLRAMAQILRNGSTTPTEVRVRDVGPTGIGLMTSETIPAGEAIKLVCRRSDGTGQMITCIVKYCRKTGGPQFSVGAVFQGQFEKLAA